MGKDVRGLGGLLLEVARAVVRASWRLVGVTYRPRMQEQTSPIPRSMVWVRLPAKVHAPLSALWKKLATSDQPSPYFGGLVLWGLGGPVGGSHPGGGPMFLYHLLWNALVFVSTESRIMSVCRIPTFGSQIFCPSASSCLPCAIVHLDAQFDRKCSWPIFDST